MAASSIVDYLKGQGKDSSYAARKKLAEEQGISNYTGTAAQNTTLLKNLQGSADSPTAGKGFQVAQTPGTNANGAERNSAFDMVSSPVVTAGSSKKNTQSSETSGYTPSTRVNSYYNTVQSYEGDEPDGYESKYSTQIDSILNSILNREQFSYDMNEDALYQQYKDAYMRQGQQAMRDTIGNASALTGGYGSTYAQTVGSQAYDQYLAGLNDKVPELYELAYNKYLNEGNEMYNQLSTLQGLDNTDYARYRDTVNDYYTNRDYYNNRYNQEYGYDYGQYQDELAQENWEQQFEYQKEQDALAQQNWQTQFDYQKEQDALNYALAQQKLAASRSSGNSKKETNYTTKDLVAFAKDLLNEKNDRSGNDGIGGMTKSYYVYDASTAAEVLMNYLGLDASTAKNIVLEAQKESKNKTDNSFTKRGAR